MKPVRPAQSPCLVASLVLALAGCGSSAGPRGGPTRAAGAKAETRAASALELVPQLGHSTRVVAVGMSPDGALAFTGGVDRALKVWDASSGALIRTVAAHAQTVTSIATSPDGRIVATGGSDKRVKLWDVATGKLVRALEDDEEVREVAFSRDGNAVLAGGPFHVRGWATATGAALPNRAPDKLWVRRLAPDASSALFDGDDGLVLLDVATGARRGGFTSTGLPGDATAISSDGRRVIAGSRDGTWGVFDLDTGSPVAKLALDPKAPRPTGVALSSDGRRAATGTDAGVVVWDAQTGRRLREVAGAPPLSFSRDGSKLLTAAADSGARLWNVETGERLQALSGRPPAAVYVAVSTNGRKLVTGTADRFRTWDLSSLAADGPFEGQTEGSQGLALSADGRRAVASHFTQARGVWFELYDVGARARLAAPTSKTSDLLALGLSPDGTRFLAGGEGHVLGVFGDSGLLASAHQDVQPVAVAVSPDGRRAVAGNADGSVRTWELPALTTLRRLEPRHRGWVWSVAFTPDGRRVLSGGDDGLKIWDAETGGLVRSIELGRQLAVAIAPEGRRALAGGDDAVVRLVDLESGSIVRTFEGLAATVRSVAFARDGKIAFCGSEDGTARAFRLDTGASIVFGGDGDDWLVHSDDGYFDASRAGGRLVAAVEGLRAYRIDQLAVRYNRPDLLLSRMGLGSPALVAHLAARHARRLARLGLREDDLAAAFTAAPKASIAEVRVDGRFADVALDLAASGRDLLRYDVWVDDVPIFGTEGRRTSGRSQRARVRVELGAGRNKLEVGVTDVAGAESLRDFRIVTGSERAAGSLWFVGFGVSKYADARLDLGFAHKDVLDLADVLRAARGSRFADVHVRTLVDAQVTADSIRSAKAGLRDAGVDDTVVVVVAGHGTHTRDAAADYVYLTHDTDVRRLRETAAPFSLIEDLFDGIAPRKKLLLLDTCESGEREPDERAAALPNAGTKIVARTTRALELVPAASAAPPPSPRPFLFDRERFIYNDVARRTGAVVLSSSRGAEVSFEGADVQNGFFTEAVMVALTGPAADRDGDGAVSVDELTAYVGSAVAARTAGKQHPTVDRDNLEARIVLPLVPSARAVVERPAAPR